MFTISSIRLVMALSGTVVFLIWLIVDRIYGQKHFTEKWRRNLLLISLVFYLAPFPALTKYFYSLEFIAERRCLYGKKDGPFMIINLGNGQTLYSPAEKFIRVLGVFITVICIMYACYILIVYWYFKRMIQKIKSIQLSPGEASTFNALKKNFKVHAKTALIKTHDISSPFASGVIHPMVFLPEDFNIEESGYQNIIKHELTHIRHHDMLITILAVTALILHWYNPFCYYYLYKLQNLNEMYNDEMVAKSMNRSEKTEYCRLMIQFSIQPDSFRQRALTLNLSGTSKKTFERRIDTVMSTKKKSSLLLPIITGMLCICMGTCSAFAYSEACEQDVLENSYDFNSDSYFIEEYMEDELLPYDEFFTDEAGNVSPVPSIEPKVSCRHSYKKGTQTIHIKKGKGCVIKYYHSNQCQKCKKTIRGKLYNRQTWKVCRH